MRRRKILRDMLELVSPGAFLSVVLLKVHDQAVSEPVGKFT